MTERAEKQNSASAGAFGNHTFRAWAMALVLLLCLCSALAAFAAEPIGEINVNWFTNDDGTVTFRVENSGEGYKYAWYTVDDKLQKISEQWYSEDPTFTADLSEENIFGVTAFVRRYEGGEVAEQQSKVLKKSSLGLPLSENSAPADAEGVQYALGAYRLTLETYNCDFGFPKDQKVLEMADAILDGTIWVYPTLDPLPADSLQDLDWTVQYTAQPNTFQLYLQCLNPVLYLTKAYELDGGGGEYLQTAERIIRLWDAYRRAYEPGSNPFVWYDHGTALRADNLIYYALVAKDAGMLSDEAEAYIKDLLTEHAEFLADEKNYTENHNHGIFQDQALLYCAFYLDSDRSDEYLAIAKERLEGQKNYAFTGEMVHVENSPGYATGVIELFEIAADFLAQYGDPWGEAFMNDLDQAALFMAYVTKPNGIPVELGDTDSLPELVEDHDAMLLKNVNPEDCFGSEQYLYARSLGRKGAHPESEAAFYTESGYYASHNDWSSEKYIDSTWQLFKSGYVSKTHKHADDNSMVLYSKGYDIFVDPGWYNYMSGDPYRDYLVSSAAHNTVTVDGKSYSITAENHTKTGILYYEDGERYDYVLGMNEQYGGVSFDRHYYNLGDAILIYDDLVSDSIHTYVQRFHTSEAMNLIEQNDRETVFSLADTGYTVHVQQLGDAGENSIIYGQPEEGPLAGLISRSMGLLDDVYTLQYETIGDNVGFVTLITIEDPEGLVLNMEGFSYDPETMTASVLWDDGIVDQITLESRQRINLTDVETEAVSKDTFRFRNRNVSADSNHKYKYNWYVVDKANMKAIYKTGWTKDPVFEYTFTGEGTYLIRAYTCDGAYRRNAIAAAVSYDPDTGAYKEVSSDYPYLNLEYRGQKAGQLDEDTFLFTVDYGYSLNSKIKWYVYRNGGYYTSLTKVNDPQLEYTFTEPGFYTVMYYLTTANGDNEFWNFEGINIK